MDVELIVKEAIEQVDEETGYIPLVGSIQTSTEAQWKLWDKY